MELWDAIRMFVKIVDTGIGSSIADGYAIEHLLDVIAFRILSVNPEECEDVEAPNDNNNDRYFQFIESAKKHFPNWKDYGTNGPVTSESTNLTGNPHDDVADIACEFEEALWILKNHDENSALDNLLLGYQTHWK